MYTNKMNKLTEFCFMMFLVTLAVMYFNTTIAKQLSWGAVVPLGYVLIWTKRAGTSDQGVVLRVFLNRVFCAPEALKRGLSGLHAWYKKHFFQRNLGP